MRISLLSMQDSPLAALDCAAGPGRQVAGLARALARRGEEVTVVTRLQDSILPERVEVEAGIVVEHIRAGPARALAEGDLLACLPALGRQLAAGWAEAPPDVVHAHFWTSGLVAMLASRETRSATGAGPPTVQSFGSQAAAERSQQSSWKARPPERLRIERALARDVARVIAASTVEADDLIRRGLGRSRVNVVPGGLDTETFFPGGPAAERGSWRYRVLAGGHLDERAGLGDVIRALRGVSNAELVVVVIGELENGCTDPGPEVARLRGLAHAAGVGDRVRFVGGLTCADLPALVRSADVAVSVPWGEPSGSLALEAMGCGLPVLATPVGALLDTVVDGTTGLLVPARRPDLLAAGLRRLLADPVRRQAFGLAGVDRAGARYSWERIAAETCAVYADVLGLNHRGDPAAVNGGRTEATAPTFRDEAELPELDAAP